jgi:hypothetical protein
MCACKITDARESPNDSTLAGGEGQGSRGETCQPHYRESPVSSLPERGVYETDDGGCTSGVSDALMGNKKCASQQTGLLGTSTYEPVTRSEFYARMSA